MQDLLQSYRPSFSGWTLQCVTIQDVRNVYPSLARIDVPMNPFHAGVYGNYILQRRIIYLTIIAFTTTSILYPFSFIIDTIDFITVLQVAFGRIPNNTDDCRKIVMQII
jgi:hypothetical protein